MRSPPSNQPSLSPDLYTEEYFRESCEGFDEFNETGGGQLSRRLRDAFALANVSEGMRVLDIGCGRGEILRHCSQLGATAYGIDYAPIAVSMAGNFSPINKKKINMVSLADAKALPFAPRHFHRVLLFDVAEHLYPWELHCALLQANRVLHQDGFLILHTAPNAWYDRYAYPFVRLFRILSKEGAAYPANPRGLNVEANLEVHVNEQSALSIWLALRRAGFKSKVWLQTPSQNRVESKLLAFLRQIFFTCPPFRWCFHREVYAIAWRAKQ